VARSSDCGEARDYFTDDYILHSPAGEFSREDLRDYFAALRKSFSKQIEWELINIFRYTDDGHLVEEWVQTDTYDFLRQLGAVE
jgi:predicted SnoaL-like aldol condensation-catalyzing enzyme